MAELEQTLQQSVVSLSCGKKILTEFKNVKSEIRQRQIKKLLAIQMRLQADQLDCKNLVDVGFIERMKENHKRIYKEVLNFRKSNLKYPGRKSLCGQTILWKIIQFDFTRPNSVVKIFTARRKGNFQWTEWFFFYRYFKN